ncbi:hypothetical protein MKZ38_003314 [Zalerion maritima]|uniref:Uncharacterized protein n=1 Tax=Zalerion maritima TaxID=339359 RepID=A0AAD5WRX8_9PEZI|nr:hypothetical protein MKZ38_003314 [Zalerion maritima]
MKFSSAILLFAVGLVAAWESSSEDTTTLTSTCTQTMTITQCNPTYTDCPYVSETTTPEPVETTIETTSEMPSYPAHNTTVPHPTSGFLNTTTSAGPTLVTATQTSIVEGTSATTSEAPIVTDSGAGNLFVNSGLLMGVLAAGAAFL